MSMGSSMGSIIEQSESEESKNNNSVQNHGNSQESLGLKGPIPYNYKILHLSSPIKKDTTADWDFFEDKD